MALRKISGSVSNFREETRVTGARSSHSSMGMSSHTTYRTEKEVSFRVGRTPVTMKNIKGMEMADGDEATVVGTNSSGGIKAVLIRNDTTEIIYGMSTIYIFFWAVLLTVIGFATLGIFIGIVVLPLGLYLIHKGVQLMRAHKLMAA